MPEPKTIRTWIDKGYQFFELGSCPACGKPVEFWMKNNQLIPLDSQTMETHNSSCPRAKEYRTEQRLAEGVL